MPFNKWCELYHIQKHMYHHILVDVTYYQVSNQLHLLTLMQVYA